jgi:putative tryptophan/tyrosine transport system substrate-binding protein
MNRRDLITLLGGAAAWPVAAGAQQTERMRRIGVLATGDETAPQTQERLGAFRKGLEALGWVEGRNIRIDYRYSTGNPERLRTVAAELVALAPEAILSNPPGLPLLQQMTSTIPVVFVVLLDPVGQGIVANLARPGGNMTGFAAYDPSNNTKYLQLLKEIAPGVARVAFMHDPQNAGTMSWPDALAAAGPLFGVKAYGAPVRNTAEVEQSIEALVREPNGALLLANNVPIVANLELIIALATRHRLPTMGFFRYFPANGALMSYGFDDVEQFRQAAYYVDRILKGEKPAELPVQYPTKYQLIINLKTAKTLGLSVPPTLLVAADEVIE